MLDKHHKYEEEFISILHCNVYKWRTKYIMSVKIQWKHSSVKKATWETKKDMQDKYHELFIESIALHSFIRLFSLNVSLGDE